MPRTHLDFKCPYCGNFTHNIIGDSKHIEESGFDERAGRDYHIFVNFYLVKCDNCDKVTTVGQKNKWLVPARGPIAVPPVSAPSERILQFPYRRVDVPKGIPQKVRKSFIEAVKSLDIDNKIAGGAMLRNTIRLLAEEQEISEDDLTEAVKKLPLSEELLKVVKDIKLLGDHSLHYEEYEKDDLDIALNFLLEAIDYIYKRRQNLNKLHAKVSKKQEEKKTISKSKN